MKLRFGFALAVAVALGVAPERAQAFTHVVVQGDTLASIAEKYYGKIQYEKFLVDANLLGIEGGSPIVKGMRLEVPSVGHRTVRHGDTWEALAAELLGAANRSDVLSMANGSNPWLTPEEGAELIVPYNLRVLVAGSNETLVTIAFKYYGDMNKAWVLDRYNGLNGHKIEPNDVVLVPLTDLPLSEAGKKAAQQSAGNTCSEAMGSVRDAQRKVSQEIPALIADVKSGRYVDAAARGGRFLASGALTEPEQALVNRQLLEAYVALDATGLATQACTEWRKRDKGAVLDPDRAEPEDPRGVRARWHVTGALREGPARLRQALDWGKLAPLRLRAKSVADGVYAGGHRSRRRGAGIEFGGQRSYVPGDDLRFIDRHALLRHGTLLVRQFETETDRTLCILLDASFSMSYRGERAPGPKYAYAALIAAALTKIAVAAGDRVSLDWFGGERTVELATAGGREAFERVVGALETAQPSADLRADLPSLERAVARVERRAMRGASVVVLSDLLDLPERAEQVLGSLGARGKTLSVVRVLDPDEIDFPFSGPLHLRALEGEARVETDAAAARPQYLAALAADTHAWSEHLLTRGGSLISLGTGDDPIKAVRKVLDALGGMA